MSSLTFRLVSYTCGKKMRALSRSVLKLSRLQASAPPENVSSDPVVISHGVSQVPVIRSVLFILNTTPLISQKIANYVHVLLQSKSLR